MPTALETARRAIASGEVEVLVSDLDGVLRHHDTSLWHRLDAELHLPEGTAYRAVLGSPFLHEVTRGRASHAQWREEAVRELTERGASPASARSAVERWASTPAAVDVEVAELLRWARDHGAEVFVFTNGTDRVPEEMAQLGLEEFTAPEGSHLINSARLGSAKPHEAAYGAAHRLIQERLGREVPRDAVMFLDDSASHVDGARAFGWRARRYRGENARR